MPTFTLYHGEAIADQAPDFHRPALRLLRGEKDVIHVAVVEPFRPMRSAVLDVLERQADVHVTGEATSTDQAVELVRRTRPDVVVLDSELPGALDTTRRILHESYGRTRVLLLSAEERGDCVVKALRAGVRGVLAKDPGSSELLDAVHALARGDALLSPGITRVLISRYTG